MPFYFYKPVNSSAFTISDRMVVIPATVEFFNCGHCFFTVFHRSTTGLGMPAAAILDCHGVDVKPAGSQLAKHTVVGFGKVDPDIHATDV